MGVIHKLPPRKPEKFGFKRARKIRRGRDTPNQLDMFSAAQAGRIVSLPTRLSSFDEALLLDERGSDAAAAAYRRAIKDGDLVPDAYCNLGILSYHAGNTDEALDCFTKSLKIDTQHFESHYNLANLFFDLGDLTAARVQYEVASSINDKFANLYFNLGLVYAIEEDLQSAFRAFNTYRALAPDDEGREADDILSTLRASLAETG